METRTKQVRRQDGSTFEVMIFSMSEDEYRELRDDCGGFCFGCGEQAYGVEPDARRYECESCSERRVYGVEEAMLMGRIEIETDA